MRLTLDTEPNRRQQRRTKSKYFHPGQEDVGVAQSRKKFGQKNGNKGSETKYLGWSATLTCRFSLLVVEGWHINWVWQGYFSLPRYFSLSAPIHNLCYSPLAFAVAVVLSSESSVTISTSLPAICLTACKWARYRFTLHHIYSQLQLVTEQSSHSPTVIKSGHLRRQGSSRPVAGRQKSSARCFPSLTSAPVMHVMATLPPGWVRPACID